MKYLTMNDFRSMSKGQVRVLGYNDTNQGTFVWVYDHVGPRDGETEDRVWGQFAYSGEELTNVGAYLYEFNGYVCRGSGAEAVFDVEPMLHWLNEGE